MQRRKSQRVKFVIIFVDSLHQSGELVVEGVVEADELNYVGEVVDLALQDVFYEAFFFDGLILSVYFFSL